MYTNYALTFTSKAILKWYVYLKGGLVGKTHSVESFCNEKAKYGSTLYNFRANITIWKWADKAACDSSFKEGTNPVIASAYEKASVSLPKCGSIHQFIFYLKWKQSDLNNAPSEWNNVM